MANEIYTDPSAKADVLGLNSPENQQIASQIMEKGLGNTLNTLNTGGGEGSEIPMGMPPTPQNDAAFAGAAGLPSPEESLKSIKRMMQEEVRADWVMRNADKKMPGSNMTWGEYFEQIYERAEEETPGSGKDAIDTVIDGIIKQEEIDADPNQQNVNMPQVPTLPLPGNETQMAAAAGNIAAAEGAPPMPPIPDQGGIMTAANGGVVGFNLGGMNQHRSSVSFGDLEYRAELDPKLATTPLGRLGYVDIREKTGGDVSHLIKNIVGNPEKNYVYGDHPNPKRSIYGTSRRGTYDRKTGIVRANTSDWVDKFGPKLTKLKASWQDLNELQRQDGGDRVMAHELGHHGIQLLREAGKLPKDFGEFYEEDILRVLDSVGFGTREGDTSPSWKHPGQKFYWGEGPVGTSRSPRPPYRQRPDNRPEENHVDYARTATGVMSGKLDELTPYEQELATLIKELNRTATEEIASRKQSKRKQSEAPGGVVGFNLGGMNQAPVSEEEFMNVLNAEAQTAGVSPDQMAAVTEMATNATGGPAAANDNVMDTGIMQNVEAVEATEEDLSGIGSLATMNEKLVEAGEEGLAHVSPGELIFDPSRLDEPAQRMLLAALETAGIDPAAATVGNEANILNQMTGLPAFGWFSRVWKKITKPVKKVGKFLKRNAGTILGIAGAMTGQPWLAALGSGIGSLIEGKPLGQALLSAGMSFAGTKWVGPWIGEQISGIAGSISPTAGAAVDAPVGDIFGGKMATLGAEGVAIKAAENAAAKAAAQAAIEGGLGASSEKLAIEAAKRSLAAASQRSLAASSQGLFSGAGLSNVTQGALDQSAQRIGQKVARDLASKAITTSLAATAPAYGGASSFLQSGLGRSIADVGGGITAGALQQATTPMIEASMFGDPNAEAEALAAWNERYNYTPSAQELYEFYTNEYIPNQQVDPGIIGGTPGYQTAAMGNLGMNFAPPPPPGTAGLLPNSLGIFNAAGGGYVNGIGGPRTDSNLARLSDGEFVMTEQAVRGAGNGDRADGAARMLGIMQGFERSAA